MSMTEAELHTTRWYALKPGLQLWRILTPFETEEAGTSISPCFKENYYLL